MSDDHVRSASIVFDVEDADNGERFRVYRCDECKALVLSDDAREHLWWHDALSFTPGAPSASQGYVTDER